MNYSFPGYTEFLAFSLFSVLDLTYFTVFNTFLRAEIQAHTHSQARCVHCSYLTYTLDTYLNSKALIESSF